MQVMHFFKEMDMNSERILELKKWSGTVGNSITTRPLQRCHFIYLMKCNAPAPPLMAIWQPQGSL